MSKYGGSIFNYRKAQEDAFRNKTIRNYGKDLGQAYLGYIGHPERERIGVNSKPSEANQDKGALFAEAVVSAFESGDHDSRVKAVKALLGAVEHRVNEVGRNIPEY